jgi:hypothetical protein
MNTCRYVRMDMQTSPGHTVFKLSKSEWSKWTRVSCISFYWLSSDAGGMQATRQAPTLFTFSVSETSKVGRSVV